MQSKALSCLGTAYQLLGDECTADKFSFPLRFWKTMEDGKSENVANLNEIGRELDERLRAEIFRVAPCRRPKVRSGPLRERLRLGSRSRMPSPQGDSQPVFCALKRSGFWSKNFVRRKQHP